jgi:hypothetical protein
MSCPLGQEGDDKQRQRNPVVLSTAVFRPLVICHLGIMENKAESAVDHDADRC